jgi:hypothetical protein
MARSLGSHRRWFPNQLCEVNHHTAEAPAGDARTIGTPGQAVSRTPRSSTGDQLTSAAIAAVQKWPHRPNLLNGIPLKLGRSSRWPSEQPEGNTRIGILVAYPNP